MDSFSKSLSPQALYLAVTKLSMGLDEEVSQARVSDAVRRDGVELHKVGAEHQRSYPIVTHYAAVNVPLTIPVLIMARQTEP